MMKKREISIKSHVFDGKIVSDRLCHFGHTKQAEVNICGASINHFGPFYQYSNMTPVLFIIEVAWAEVTEATKNNKIMKKIDLR